MPARNSGGRHPPIDFARVKGVAIQHIDELLAELLPDGKRNAGNWVACNPLRGEKNPSFSVSLETGAFFDHASGDKGGDLVALVAYLRQMSQADAARELSQRFRLSSTLPVSSTAAAAKAARSRWTPLSPAPADVPYPLAHSVRGKAARIWEYRAEDGSLIGIVQRHETSDGGKELIPYSYAQRDDGRREWRPLAFAEPRPLYGLQHLRPDKAVLVVEGEKCADAARDHLGEFLDVVTWPGGGNAVGKVDWSPVAKRRVIVWPDADGKRDKATQELLPLHKQPGWKAGQRVAELLVAQGCDVRVLQVPAPGEVKDGWDIVDAIDDGWDVARLQAFITSALQQPAVAVTRGNSPPPGEPSDPGEPPDDDWQRRLIYRKGELVACLANAVEILRHSHQYGDALAYDEFAMRIVKRKTMSSHVASIDQLTEWTDDDDGYVGMWLQQTHHLISSTTLVSESVSILSREHRYHPVRDYLEGLRWDGVRRVDHWLERYLGVPSSEYSRRVARWYLMGMCKRVLEPGCKFDYCLVLEGQQGLLKSGAFRVLGGDWYSDVELDLQNKDAMSSIRGKWVHEFAEMGSIARSEELRQKSFLSRQVDEFRPAFARREIRCPRQLVFGGTTNQWAWNKDPTGGRRFWPVEVTEVVDIAGLTEARDQLLAEAMAMVHAGNRYWPTFEEQKDLFDPEQLKREAPEVYVELIERWFDRDDAFWATHAEFSVADAILHGLKIEASKITRDVQTRVGIALNKLECDRIERRTGPVRYVYKRPDRKVATSVATSRAAEEHDDVPI